MRSKFTKKRMLTLVSVLVVALAGIAYAFYTSTGDGQGSASAANTDGSSIHLTGTVSDALAPGGTSPVTFSATNDGTAAGTIRSIHLVSVTADSGHSACDTSKFTMPNVTGLNISVPNDAPATHALGSGANGTMTFANDPDNSQDNCKGANLSLVFTTG